MSEWMEGLSHFSFTYPWVLWGLAAVAGLLWLRGRRGGEVPSMLFSDVALLAEVAKETRSLKRGWPERWSRPMILVLLVAALAGPRMDRGWLEREAEGIDLQIALDLSRSMEVEDMWMEGRQVSRFEVVREVMSGFLEERPQDRIGLVGFARRGWLLCPPTLDHAWVKRTLEGVSFDVWTAVGEGIDTALYYLPPKEDQDQVIVVLSDGYSNQGVPPEEAAERARARGVRIYAIQFTPRPGGKPREEEVLFAVARRTGGRFYQTRGVEGLRGVLAEIGRLETGTLKDKTGAGHRDLTLWVLVPALGWMALELAGMWREGRAGA